MHLPQTFTTLLGVLTLSQALAHPSSLDDGTSAAHDLFKRKGGGGGGGRGGGGSGGSRGSGSTSSGNSGSRGSGSTTSSGSGPPRPYGGGAYYGGGAATPYSSGARRGGVAPYVLGGAALGFLPGIWLASVYLYSWPGYYTWRNTTTNEDETGPVDCLCGENAQCSCENNNNTDYLTAVANNGSIAYRAENGTLYINGTLPDGTTPPDTGAAGSLSQSIKENTGIWVVVAGVTYAVSFL